MDTQQATNETPLISCRKCGDDMAYDPRYEPIVDERGRNRVMCNPCIWANYA